jgi:signal transduction histidine kinase
MSLNILALLVTAFSTLALGAAVFVRASSRPANRLYGLHALSVALWVIYSWLILIESDPVQVAALLRWAHVWSAALICTFIAFTHVFPARLQVVPGQRNLAVVGLWLLASGLAFLPGFVSEVRSTPAGFDIQYGPIFLIYAAFVVGGFGYIDLVLYRKARTLRGLQQVQVVYVLVGAIGAQVVGFVANMLIPILWGTTAFSSWGAVGYLTTVVAMAYAIAKHQLLDLSIFGRRLIALLLTAITLALPAYLLSVLLFEPLVAMSSPAAQAVLRIGVGILVGLAVLPVWERLQSWVDRNWGNHADRLAEVFSTTAETIARTTDTLQVLQLVAVEIQRLTGAEVVRVYVESIPGGEFRCRVCSAIKMEKCALDHPPLEANSPILNYFRTQGEVLYKDQILRLAPLQQASQLVPPINALGCEVLVPMLWAGQLVGMFTLGAKHNGQMYHQAELDLCANVAVQTALAVVNGRLYDEVIAAKEYNETIINQMQSGLLVADLDGVVRLCNPAAELILEVSGEWLTGQTIQALPPLVGTALAGEIAGQSVANRRGEIELESGPRALGISTFTLHGRDNQPLSVGVVIHDFSVLEALEQERREADRLRLMRTISAGMAHEIRNPLMAIRTFAELAPLKLDDPEFRSDFLEVAQSEIKRIENLISHLLVFSKPISTHRQPIDLNELVEEVVKSASAAVVTEGLTVQSDLALDLPLPMGDKGRLRQAVVNLLYNALDATPPGGTVRLTTRPGAGGSERTQKVELTVWNSGSYISPEEMREIFIPFYTSKDSGTGLGLAICQTVVEEHGGGLRVDSSLRGGTEFIIELPVAAVIREEPQVVTGL